MRSAGQLWSIAVQIVGLPAPRSNQQPFSPDPWEVYDDERGAGEPVHRSMRRFRTPKEAWEAGSLALDIHLGALTLEPVPSAERSRWAVVVTRTW
jgi:hypothetical protein